LDRRIQDASRPGIDVASAADLLKMRTQKKDDVRAQIAKKMRMKRLIRKIISQVATAFVVSAITTVSAMAQDKKSNILANWGLMQEHVQPLSARV
jgi:N-methylhydantoinase B/oxoprolinase/acetone carboxylase alpha subunit